MVDLLFFDLGLWQAVSGIFAINELAIFFECGDAFCACHHIADGGQVAFGFE